MAAAVHHDQVGAAIAGEVAYSQADRLYQRTDRWIWPSHVDAVKADPGAAAVAVSERMGRVVEKNHDIAAALVADHDVNQAIAVDVHQGKVRRGLARGQGDGRAKR